MKGLVALYGFGGGSGGTGAALTVNAPAGVTVTVSKDGKSKKKTANSLGIAVFKGLSTGEWTVTITDGEKTASKPVTIIADFNKTITFFSATIHVTYPAGSTCTATDGVTTLTAPDTSGTWACVVPNAGTWTVSSTGSPWQAEVTITTAGQAAEADVTKLYLQKGSFINSPTSFTNVKTRLLDNGVKYMQNGHNSRATVHFGPVGLTEATKLFVKLDASFAYGTPVPGFCVKQSLLNGYPSSDLVRFRGSYNDGGDMTITAGTYTMDISGYSGDYYVALFWEGRKVNDTHLTAEAIWLEI